MCLNLVGYGDFYPKTYPGRMVALCACIMGTFIVSFLINAFTASSQFNEDEQKVHLLFTTKPNDMTSRLTETSNDMKSCRRRGIWQGSSFSNR